MDLIDVLLGRTLGAKAALNADKTQLSLDAVKFTPQALTDAQKAQARQNIGADNVVFVDFEMSEDPDVNKSNIVTEVFIDGEPVESLEILNNLIDAGCTLIGRYTGPAMREYYPGSYVSAVYAGRTGDGDWMFFSGTYNDLTSPYMVRFVLHNDPEGGPMGCRAESFMTEVYIDNASLTNSSYKVPSSKLVRDIWLEQGRLITRMVSYKEQQSLTDEEKAQARANIGAAESGSGGIGTAYIDVTMTSEDAFVMSYKGSDIGAVGVVNLVNSGYSVIAKVPTDSDTTEFVPLANVYPGGKTVVTFSAVIALGDDAAGLVIARCSSDDGNVGSFTILPL